MGLPKRPSRVRYCFRNRLSGGTLFCCKGNCGRAGRGAERGTSRGSEGFSLLCNDKLNKGHT